MKYSPVYCRHLTNTLSAFNFKLLASIACAMAWACLSTGLVHAQNSYTWNGLGGDNNFGTGGNWVGGSAPSSLQSFLNFAGSTRTSPNNNYADYSGGYRIFFNSGTSPFTITGNHIKFFDFGGNSPQIENDSSSLQTINFGFGVGSPSGGTAMNINPITGDMAFGASSGNVFSYFDDQGLPLTINGNNNGHTVTFWGPIGNGGVSTKFILAQNAVVVFNAANTYTGETDLNAGELRIGSAGAISASAIFLGNGTTLTTSAQLTLTNNGGQTFTNNFTVNNSSGGQYRVIAGANSSGTNAYSGAITLSGDANLSAQNAGGTINFSGAITTGGGKFATATGPGNVVLTGATDNSGIGINANGGTLILAKASSSGVHAVGVGVNVNSGGTVQLGGSGGDQIFNSANVTVNNGGVLDMNGQSETFNLLNLAGTGISSGGALINSSASAAALTAIVNVNNTTGPSVGGTGDIAISGTVSNASTATVLTKIGNDTLTLAGTTDNVNLVAAVNAGTLVLGKTSSSTVHALGGATDTINSGATLKLGGSGGDQIYTGTSIFINGGGVLDMAGLSEGFNALNGIGVISNSAGAASLLTVGEQNGGGTFFGNIKDGTASGAKVSLTKAGAGTLTLGGFDTYSGDTRIGAGTLMLTNSLPLQLSTLDWNGTDSGSLAFGPPVHTATLGGLKGTRDLSTDIVLSIGNNGSNTTYSGVLSGSGSLVKIGSGTLTLSGANAYAGDTTVSNGTLQLGAANVIPDGAGKGNVFVASTLDLNTFSDTVNGLSGPGVVDTVAGGTPTLTVGANDQSSTFSGTIKNTAGTLALIKTGASALTLSGANTYNGDTTISQGTLALTGTGSLSNSANVVVSSGATLDVSGRAGSTYTLATSQTLKGNGGVKGTVVVASGATVAPGTSIGTLYFTNAPTLQGTTLMEINRSASPNADKLGLVSGAGTLAFGGVLQIVNIGPALQLNDTFDLFDADSFSGAFSSINRPTPPAGLMWDTSQVGPGGNGAVKVVCLGSLAANAGSAQGICPGGSVGIGGSPTASGGSGAGYIYNWSPAAGLSSTNVANPTAAPTTTTTYTVKVTDSVGCTSQATVTVTVNSLPSVFTVNGGGAYCTGGTGVNVGLSGSESGVDYHLRFGGSDVGAPVPGTGSAISFGPQTAAGTYTVVASNVATTCTAPMTGSAGVIASLAGPLKWVGGNGNWDFTTLADRWRDSLPNNAVYCDGYDVLLDDSASTTSPTLTLSATVTPLSLTNNSTKNYTISGSGKITGSASVTKLGGSTLTLATANDYAGGTRVAVGTLKVSNSSGSASGSGAVSVAAGAILSGNGSIAGALTLDGTVSPGSSPGALGTGPASLNGGGKYVWEIADATGTAGSGCDLLRVIGGLSVQSASANTFTIEVRSLAGDSPGNAANFSSAADYTWPIATVTDAITNFSADKFTLDTTAFSNSLAGGRFSLVIDNATNLAVRFLSNRPPVAVTDFISRPASIPFKVLKSDLLTNDYDPEGYTITFVSVSSSSTNNVPITTDATNIFYDPPNSDPTNDVTDSFTYTISDGYLASVGTVIVTIAPPPTNQTQTITSITNNSDGTVTIGFAGIPGYTYAVQAATDLSSPIWVPIGTNVAGTNGLWFFTDYYASNFAGRYYRSAKP